MMEEKRIFNLGNMTLQETAHMLEQYLSVQKHLTTQKFEMNSRIVLQCADSDSHWKQFIGLDAALTIELAETGNNTLTITIGNAKWLDKVGAAAVGALFFSPLVVVAGIGAVRQAVLPTEIFTFVESRLGTAKQNSSVRTQPSFFSQPEEPEEPEETITCPCCGSPMLKTHAFCSKCGTKL